MKSAITIALLAISITINAQSPSYTWSKTAIGAKSEEGESCVADASGNVYVIGTYWSPTVTFGAFTLKNSDQYMSDIFILKYDSNGNVLWAKSAGGKSIDQGHCIAIDGSGNVYVTGAYNASISFGSIKLTNKGEADLFVAKYDTNGKVLWAKGAGGTRGDEGQGIAADANGNVYVTGYFSETAAFGTVKLTGAGSWDVFTAKYNTNGDVLWVQSAGGSAGDTGKNITTDRSGNVYVTGSYDSYSFAFGTIELKHFGGDDIFTVKYDSNGIVLWAKGSGGDINDEGGCIATDVNGNVYVSGYFRSSEITFGSFILKKNGGGDVFTVKYDSNGNVLWAKSMGGDSDDNAHGMAVDASGNVIVTGSYKSSTIEFGESSRSNKTGASNIFIMKYDSNGNEAWIKSASGTSVNYASGCGLDGKGNIYVTGTFLNSTVTFGSTTLEDSGGSNFFVLKMGE
ncbi:MAG TPA: SBBP repeat-containing protein [Bacteroidia bacterium]|nr:SBBP repeat-containing protein [Bacteroidia bacterium]